MPSLNLTLPHTLSQDEAVTRLKQALPVAKERAGDKISDLKEDWQGNELKFGFKTFGMEIKGDLKVEPSEVKVNVGLPLVAMMAKGKIEQTLRDELSKVLT